MSHFKEYSNYDEIIKFDYTARGEWERFVREKILPLYRSAYVIKKLCEELEKIYKNLSDIIWGMGRVNNPRTSKNN